MAALGIKIADFREILENESRLLELVKDEAIAVKAKFNDERRTEIAAVSGEVDIEDLITRKNVVERRGTKKNKDKEIWVKR